MPDHLIPLFLLLFTEGLGLGCCAANWVLIRLNKRPKIVTSVSSFVYIQDLSADLNFVPPERQLMMGAENVIFEGQF